MWQVLLDILMKFKDINLSNWEQLYNFTSKSLAIL